MKRTKKKMNKRKDKKKDKMMKRKIAIMRNSRSKMILPRKTM